MSEHEKKTIEEKDIVEEKTVEENDENNVDDEKEEEGVPLYDDSDKEDDEKEDIVKDVKGKPAPELPVAVLLQDFDRAALEKRLLDRITELGGGEDEASIVAGRRLFEENALNPESDDYSLFLMEMLYSRDVARAREFLSRIKPTEEKNKDFTFRYREDGASVSSLRSAKICPPKIKGNVRGADALMMINTASRGGMRNVMLYNSMIAVDIRRPTIDEIQTLLSNCESDFDKFGGILGAQYYLFEDYLLKKHFINFLFKLIVRSSLRNWEDGEQAVLMQAFQLNDYAPLLVEVAQLMYPDGFEHFQHICQRPKDKEHPKGCNHRQELNLDLWKLPKVRFSAIPKKCKDYLARCAQTSNVDDPLDEVLNRQKELGFGEDIVVGRYRFRISPPSLFAYVEAGEAIYSAIVEETQGANSAREFAAISTKALRFWLPWVERLTFLPEEGESSDDETWTDDKFAISQTLDSILDDPKYAKHFEKAISKIADNSNLTFIGYKTPKCSKCGYTAPEDNQFMGVDAQSAFFTMAMEKYRNALSVEEEKVISKQM